MIANDQELKTTLERIARFQEQVAELRAWKQTLKTITAGIWVLAEINRMQLDVRNT